MFDSRLRAILDLSVPRARLDAGRHEYDGTVQDLSLSGVREALRRLGGSPYADEHDEAHVSAAEQALRVRFGELELHRVNPMWHVENLELDCYDRDYAPAADRAEARRLHLSQWPDAVDAAVRSLDRMPAAVAQAVLPSARGLSAYLPAAASTRPEAADARRALDRFLAHLESAATPSSPSSQPTSRRMPPADSPTSTPTSRRVPPFDGEVLGEDGLARLLGASEAVDVDLGRLAARADAERDRLRAMLADACDRLAPDQTIAETLDRLDDDHPTAADLVERTRELVGTVLDWTRDSGLVPVDDGTCEVGTTPASQPWQVATMTSAAPYEPDAPSWFRVTPPPSDWPAGERDAWLRTYSRPQLMNIAIHEVAPGHFSHGRALRRVTGDVRRSLHSSAFSEGWAHYCEELALEQGFGDGDPAFAAAVARDGLLRVTRLACTIGLHTGEMTLDEAAHRMVTDAYVHPAMAHQRAARGLFDPTMGEYTWGKLVILDIREQAQKTWGAGFSLPRFHKALLDLGSAPLGLLPTAIERG